MLLCLQEFMENFRKAREEEEANRAVKAAKKQQEDDVAEEVSHQWSEQWSLQLSLPGTIQFMPTLKNVLFCLLFCRWGTLAAMIGLV